MNLNLADITSSNFENYAKVVFEFQYDKNLIYNDFCNFIKVNSNKIVSLEDIPFLPISFFKSHAVISSNQLPIDYFESSGTSLSQVLSKHYIVDYGMYESSIELGFRHFFGQKRYTIVGLLPHYLDRPHSSLIYMVRLWMKMNGQKEELFFLHDFEDLSACISKKLEQNESIILICLSSAILDYAVKSSFSSPNLTIIETGGMKGKRPELLKEELIMKLKSSFPQSRLMSEYGMCELFSQAFSDENLLFFCPPWMKIMVSDINDPLSVRTSGTGIAKIIDLANCNSCSFIETQDLIDLYPDGRFQIIGRVDHSEMRGCSLMYQ